MGPLSFGLLRSLLVIKGLEESLVVPLADCLKEMELDTLRVVALIEADIARTRLIFAQPPVVWICPTYTTVQRSKTEGVNRSVPRLDVSFLRVLYPSLSTNDATPFQGQ